MADVERVVDKFIDELRGKLAEKRVSLDLTEAARRRLAEEGFDRLHGARPMARLIQQRIAEPLSEAILFGKLQEGGRAAVKIRKKRAGPVISRPAIRYGLLKLQVLGGAGKGDDIADIGDAGDHHQKALEAQPETGVRDRAEASDIEIPPVVLRGQPEFVEAPFEHLQAFFPLTPADKLADTGAPANPWPPPSDRRRSVACRRT